MSIAGNNANSGNEDAPLRSIQRAVNLANSGDTVSIRSGIYSERLTLTSRSGITIRSAPGEQAIIDQSSVTVPGAASALVRLHYCNDITIQDLELRNFKTSTNGIVPIGIYVSGGGSGIKLIGNHIHGIWHSHPEKYNYDSNAHGILVAGSATVPISDLEIRGNRLHNLRLGSSEALVLNGNVDGFKVVGNTIYDANNIGIDFIGFEGTNPNPALDFARNGICSQNVVYNIDSRFNPAYGGSFSGGNNDTRGAVGIYADGGSNIIIERNHVFSCNIGIEAGSEHAGRVARAITIRNNLIRRNHVAGIFLGGYSSAVGGAANCEISHNTIYQNDVVGYGGGQIAIQHRVSGTTITHNIVVANAATRQLIQMPTGTSSFASNAIDWNLYSGAAASNGYFLWRGRELNGLGAWRAGAGQDGHSFFASDPGFADAAGLDFSLRENAAALNAGDPTFEYGVGEADYFGKVRTHEGRTDMGMAERGAPQVEGPTVATGGSADITYHSATIEGTITPGVNGATVWFEYGPTAIYGRRSPVQFIPPSDQPVTISELLNGLTHKRYWHYRIVGNNSTGTNGGANARFFTPAMPPPEITLHPEPLLLHVGESAEFETSAIGGQPQTIRWRKNNVPLPGAPAAASRMTISAVKRTHAGKYAAAVRNDSATVVTTHVALGVVDPSNNATIVNEDANLTLVARASAPAGSVTWQWFKDGLPMTNDDRTSGCTSAKLVVKKAISSDAGAYHCELKMANMVRTTGLTQVAYRPKPVLLPYSAPTQHIISGVVTGQLQVINELIRFSAVGLPPGFRLNPRTGAVSGRPDRAGDFKVKFYAHNLAGASKPLEVKFNVLPLPLGSTGDFAGLIDRSAAYGQSDLGGAVRMTISKTSIVTGGLSFGSSAFRILRRLDAVVGQAPSLTITLPRRNASALQLEIVFDDPSGKVHGRISTAADPGSTAVPVLMVMRHGTSENAGRYNAHLLATSRPVNAPEGTGYVSCLITKTGFVTLIGRLADGSVISRASLTGTAHELPFHQVTHRGLGSVSGWQQLTDAAQLSGDLTWYRRPTNVATWRNYKSGIPLHTLSTVGLRWHKPSVQTPLFGLTNLPADAAVSVEVGAEIFHQAFTLVTSHNSLLPTRDLNLLKLKISIFPLTGIVTGSVVLPNDQGNRLVTFNAMLTDHTSPARGFSLVPELPNPRTSVLMSRSVDISPALTPAP